MIKQCMNMKHFIYTLLLLSVAPIAAAQDYEISGTQGETITLNISGFADNRSTFAYAQITGGAYTSNGFNQSTGQISFKFEKAEEYSFDFYEDLNGCVNATSILFKIKAKSTPEPEPEPEPEPQPEPEPNPQPEPNPEPEPISERIVIDIPNIFTPNGDGINDGFHINYNIRPSVFAIKIFNRNGQNIFSSTNSDFVWDGDNNVPGTYFYIINYHDSTGVKTLSGNVMIAQ